LNTFAGAASNFLNVTLESLSLLVSTGLAKQLSVLLFDIRYTGVIFSKDTLSYHESSPE
jgi:hypothetical protein